MELAKSVNPSLAQMNQPIIVSKIPARYPFKSTPCKASALIATPILNQTPKTKLASKIFATQISTKSSPLMALAFFVEHSLTLHHPK